MIAENRSAIVVKEKDRTQPAYAPMCGFPMAFSQITTFKKSEEKCGEPLDSI